MHLETGISEAAQHNDQTPGQVEGWKLQLTASIGL